MANNQKKLWKFEWDSCYAFIGGLFLATDEEIQNLIGKDVYFGEVEGKHSEVYGTIEEDEITLVTDDPAIIAVVGEFGINPLDYLEEDEK